MLKFFKDLPITIYRIITFQWLANLIYENWIKNPIKGYIVWVRAGGKYRVYFSYSWQIIFVVIIALLPYLVTRIGIKYSEINQSFILIYVLAFFIYAVFIMQKTITFTDEEEQYLELKRKQKTISGRLYFWYW